VLLIPFQSPAPLPLEQWPFGADAKDIPLTKYSYE
jgi:hypothetical protein